MKYLYISLSVIFVLFVVITTLALCKAADKDDINE